MASDSHPWRVKSSFAVRSWQKRTTYTQLPEPPLGPLLGTIQKEDLIAESWKCASSARITDCDYVASFNWRDSPKPSVFVPGKPPRWTPTGELRRLPPDRSEYPLDRNGYHFPKHPFEATALCVLYMQPEPPATPPDIVCDSSSLGYLISFCLTGVGDFRQFRVLAEVIGGAVHIFRRDNAPGQMLSNVKGYGHTFPEANTTWNAGTAGSTSHQRVVRYKLGGLSVLLRGEIDGYLPELSQEDTLPQKKASLDDLLGGLVSASLSPRAVDTTASIVSVTKAGSLAPQSSLFDLKTRSELRKGDDILGAQLPRLWRSQIPNFILAFHERGTFHDVSIENVQNRIDEWEAENAGNIAVLVALLRRIIEVVGTSPSRKVEIRATVDSEIEVRGQLPDAGEALSPDVREKWEAWLEKAHGKPVITPIPVSNKDDDGLETVGWYGWDKDDTLHLAYSDAESLTDFTACGADSCGYCGRCSY